MADDGEQSKYTHSLRMELATLLDFIAHYRYKEAELLRFLTNGIDAARRELETTGQSGGSCALFEERIETLLGVKKSWEDHD